MAWRAGCALKGIVISGAKSSLASAVAKSLGLAARWGAQTGRITATYGRMIGYLSRGYSKKGIVFRMGNSRAIVKARVGVVIAWLGLTTRTERAHVAPRFALI